MLEDFRNHDPRPSREERDWIARPLAGLARFIVMLVLAVAIGVPASHLLAPRHSPTVATATE